MNPEGVHTSPTPPPDTSTHNKGAKPIQKPGFVVNREDSTVRGGSVPPFPPKPGVPLPRDETEDSLKLTGGVLSCLVDFFHFALQLFVCPQCVSAIFCVMHIMPTCLCELHPLNLPVRQQSEVARTDISLFVLNHSLFEFILNTVLEVVLKCTCKQW